MTTTLTATFDGRVLIPAGPVDLPRGTPLQVHVAVGAEQPAEKATLDLLSSWDDEDATSDPDELTRRHQEWERFRQGMNQAPLSGRTIYP